MANICIRCPILPSVADGIERVLDIMDAKQSSPRPEMKDNSPAYGMPCVYFKFAYVVFLEYMWVHTVLFHIVCIYSIIIIP